MRIAPLAALSAALAIAAGAFGAHAATGAAAEWLRTGAYYQLTHAIAALALCGRGQLDRQAVLLLAGSVGFALTLYAMALGAPHWLGAVTPLGGVAMVVGWLWVAMRVGR